MAVSSFARPTFAGTGIFVITGFRTARRWRMWQPDSRPWRSKNRQMSYFAAKYIEDSVTTLCQWRAYEACFVLGMTQAQAAMSFGISQSAISRRIRRYRQARNEPPRPTSRKRVVSVVSLSNES